MGKRKNRDIELDEGDEKLTKFVGPKLSKKILKVARDQQKEILDQEIEEDELNSRFSEIVDKKDIDSDDDNDNDVDIDIEPKSKFEYNNVQDTFYRELKIDADDERAFEQFYIRNPVAPVSIGDLIQQKISERRTELETLHSDDDAVINQLDPAVKANYEDVKKILKCYRSGKIPKCFKFVPTLRNWEQIVYITDPSNWSAAAMYQATRIFTSNLNTKMAARFFKLVLLPRIRDDIEEYKRLNFHLYQALRKALFKPGSFMQGLVFPLLESGTCTLREALIVGSVLAKNSVPRIHSSVALLKIAEMEYTGASSILLRILLTKKYALPYRVVDAVVHHFLRLERDSRQLPVLWHQAFLVFVQIYKNNISSEQRDALLQLCKYQKHHQITPEIRRELQHAKCLDLEHMQVAEEIV